MHSMKRVWERLDADIAVTPMPGPYQNLYRSILCKDCSVLSTVQFHVIGMKCSACGGYNTSLEGPFLKQVTITERLGEEEVVRTEFKLLTDGELETLGNQPPRLPESDSDDQEEAVEEDEDYDTIEEVEDSEDSEDDGDHENNVDNVHNENVEDTALPEENQPPSADQPTDLDLD